MGLFFEWLSPLSHRMQGASCVLHDISLTGSLEREFNETTYLGHMVHLKDYTPPPMHCPYSVQLVVPTTIPLCPENLYVPRMRHNLLGYHCASPDSAPRAQCVDPGSYKCLLLHTKGFSVQLSSAVTIAVVYRHTKLMTLSSCLNPSVFNTFGFISSSKCR